MGPGCLPGPRCPFRGGKAAGVAASLLQLEPHELGAPFHVRGTSAADPGPFILRVSLFLSKMRTPAQSPAPSSTSCEEDAGAVRTRAAELLTLLKMPSVAQFVLTPSTEVSEPRYHRDANTALPLALRTVSRLVEKETGLLPG